MRVPADGLQAGIGETDRTLDDRDAHARTRRADRRDSRVIYRVTDGGVVSDESAHVRVPQPTTVSAWRSAPALSRSSERWRAERGGILAPAYRREGREGAR